MNVPLSSRPGSARSLLVFSVTSLAFVTIGCADSSEPAPAPVEDAVPVVAEAPRATARIAEPAEAAELPAGGVRVVLQAENITIAPASDTTANTGHHHLLLNMPIPAEGEAVPAAQTGIVHLGQAQTEYTFEDLAPGDYTLIAVIGDFAHRVLPQATDTVTFRVVAP